MDLKETETLSRQFIEAYVRGDYRKVAGMLHPSASVGRTSLEKCAVKEKFLHQTEHFFRSIYDQMGRQEYRLVYSDVKTALVEVNCLLQKKYGHKTVNRYWQMVFLWEKMNQGWKIRRLQAQERKDGQLCVHSADGFEYFIWEHNICYIETLQSKVYIHCPEQTILVRSSMAKLLEVLSDKFIQVHRSFIVNADYVTGIRRYEVQMSDHTCIPVPEKKYREIKGQLQMWKQ